MTSTMTSTSRIESNSRKFTMNVSRSFALFSSAALALSMFGCSAGMPVNSVAPITTPASQGLKGTIHGGQQAVVGSQVYLYAVGTTGYASAATSLLTSATGNPADGSGNFYALTDASGNFNISSHYSCPTGTSLVYLLATGGNAGSGSNNKIDIIAALGNCQTLQGAANTTFIVANEVSTAAAVYALAPFMTSATSIGAPASNLTGITNAFAEVPNLVNTAQGVALAGTPAGNGVVPAALINTVADALAVCVNSNGAVTGGATTSCDQLFSPTTVNAVVPANTVAAALSIAKNPAHNAAAITTLGGQIGSPFQPTLLSPPNDLTLAVKYSGGGISTPQAVAIDASGNAWVASANNAVTKMNAAIGSFVSGGSGYTSGSLDAPTSIAIDPGGNVWIANCGGQCSGSANASSVTRMVPSGNTVSATNLTGGALNASYAIALDGTSRAWIANSLNNAVSLFNSTGDQTGGTGYTSTYQSSAAGVAVDASGNAWVVSPAGNAVTEYTSVGAAGANTYQGTGVAYPFAVAIDASSRQWVVDQSSNALTVLNAGAPISGSPFSSGGLSTPNAIVIDGSGAAWVSNANGSVSAFTSLGVAVTPSTGYAPGSAYANSVAVDGSGSLWVTDCGSYCGGTGAGNVFQVIGVATPVVTPIAFGAAHNTLGTKP